MSAAFGHHSLLMAATSSGGGVDATATAILAKLTSYWNMDEASGNRNDSVGTNHLSEVATVSTAAGLRGTDTAVAFGAGTGGLSIASNASIQVPSGGGDHCLFGWAYLDSGGTGTQWLGGKWDATAPGVLEYGIDVETGQMLGLNGGSTYYYNGPSTPTGAWYFAVMWRDSADGKVRLQVNDGTIYASASASDPSPGNKALQFGRDSGSASLAGRLQCWGWIKGGFLDSTERTYLYNAGSGKTYAELTG